MKTKLKIAFLVKSIKNCGPINMVFNLIQNLDPEQFEIMLIGLEPAKDDYYKIIEKYCSLGIRDRKITQDALEDISNSLDIIHSHGVYPDLAVSRLTNKKVKKITTAHCMIFKDFVQEYGVLKGVLGGLLHIYALRTGKFSQVIACSEAIRSYLLTYLPSESLVAINNGVDTTRFFPLNDEDKKLRKKELGIEHKRVFIFCGRFINRKRVPEMVKYFISNFSHDSDNILFLIGDGEKEIIDECRELANNNVLFVSHTNQPEYYYQMADFVLSMSNAEGYPMSILEAVSCGCYALLSDIPPHREFINKHPETSCLIYECKSENIYNKQPKIDSFSLSAKKMAIEYMTYYQS